MSDRETWSTRVGFVLAAVGSAVGLGNIWQFPFQTASNGGAAFVLVYLVAVVLIGFPAMLAEFVIGRRTERNPVDAFRELGGGNWAAVGGVAVFTAFWILSFYGVVGGWVVRYVAGSVTGAYFGDPEAYFGSIATGPEAVFAYAVFMAIVVAIVALGVEDGIEAGTKVMVPSIVLMLLGIGVWASTLPGAGAGYDYYLSPDLGALAANFTTILPAAVGQAFFTLSLGMGAMITYASYLGEDDDLPVDGLTIVGLNTFVGLLAGFVVFPILFAQNVDPDTGSFDAVFVSMASAFAQLPASRLLGAVFFVVLLLAALSSAISLLEVVVSFVTENTALDRLPATVGLGVGVFLVGLPTALDLTVAGTWTLVWYNDVAYNLLLPLSVLGLLAFVGWKRYGEALSELRLGSDAGDGSTTLWLWAVRTFVTLGVVVTLLLGIQSLLLTAGLIGEAIV